MIQSYVDWDIPEVNEILEMDEDESSHKVEPVTSQANDEEKVDKKKVNEEKIEEEKADEPKKELQKVNNLEVDSEVLVNSASEQ